LTKKQKYFTLFVHHQVVKANDDISYFYIAYQAFLLVSTFIGPGSIVLMLVGAFSLAFNLSDTNSLIFNLVLVGIFVFSCVFMKSDHQIMIAQLLTLLYAVIMIAVYIGIFIQIAEMGPLALTSLMTFFTFASYIIAALLHPQEFWCILTLPIYLCTIPSMYLLLVIYAFFNMNDVSWGTREVPKSAADLAAEAENQAKEVSKAASTKKEGGLLGYFQSMAESKKKGNLEFSLGNIFSCLCFTTEDQGDVKKEMMLMADKLDKIEKALHIQPTPAETEGEGSARLMRHPTVKLAGGGEEKEEKKATKSKRVGFQEADDDKLERDGEKTPYWIENNEENREKCPLLAEAKEERIDALETKFWKDMIEQYLKPLYEDKDAKKKVKEGLKELKNKYSLMFMLVNSMWIAAIFMLQNSQDALNIPWRLGPTVNNITFESTMTPGQDSNNVFVNKEYSKLEPLGFFFVITFIFIMIIQFVGMLLHRLMTLGHIVASTKLGFFGAKRKLNPDEFLNKHGVEVIKEIQDTVEPPKEGVTMEEAVEQELKNITEGGDDVKRRLSRSWSRQVPRLTCFQEEVGWGS